MKKLLTLLLVASLACFSMSSCGDDPAGDPDKEQPGDGGDGGDDGDDKPTEGEESTLTPGEHQKKLEDVAKQFVGYFDADDHKQIVESLTKLNEYLMFDDEEPSVIGYEYYIGLSLDHYQNLTAELHGCRPDEQISIVSRPEFITRAEIVFNEDWQCYTLSIDADLNKMQLTGHTEGVIKLYLAKEQRNASVGVGYQKNYNDQWAGQIGYYGNDGKGKFTVYSPFLAGNIAKVKLETYGKEGYFNSVDIAVSQEDSDIAEISYSVNRNVAGTSRGRINVFLGENQIYAIDVQYEEGYWDETRSAAAFLKKSGTLALLRGAADMSTRSMTRFMTVAVSSPDYTLDLNEYKGLAYTFDNQSEEWVESESGSSDIVFKWDDSEAVISWKNSDKTWEGKVDFDETAKVYIPSEVTMSLKIGGKEHLGIKLTPDIKDNYTVSPQAVVSLNGGYAFTLNASADNKGIQASVIIAKGDTKLASAKACMSINDITDTDNWFEQETYSWEDGYGIVHTEYYNYSVLDEYVEDNVKTGQVSADILSVSIYAEGNIRAIISGSDAIGDVESKNGAILQAALINENIESYMFYNDEKAKIADIMVQPYLSDWYDYDEPEYDSGSRAHDEEYWSQEPILVFPDDSKFAFEDYFTSQKFSSLIDAVEELIAAYENMVENVEIE